MQRRQSMGGVDTGGVGGARGAGTAASPLYSILHAVRNQDKAAKQALYNCLALLGTICSICALWALCIVLEPFFRPLVWAGLVGSLLHLPKRLLRDSLDSWLRPHSPPKGNLLIAICLLPSHMFGCLICTFDALVTKYWKVGFAMVFTTFGIFWMLHFFPWRFFYFTFTVWSILNSVLNFILEKCNFIVVNRHEKYQYLFVTLVVIYVSLLCVSWSPDNQNGFKKASLLVWFVTTGFISNFTGTLKTFTFIAFQILAVAGFVIEIREILNSSSDKNLFTSVIKAAKRVISNKTDIQNSTDREDEGSISTENTECEPIENDESESKVDGIPTLPKKRLLFQRRTMSSLPLTNLERHSSFESQIVAALHRKALSKETSKFYFVPSNGESESFFYIKLLTFACILMYLWKNSWLWPILGLLVYFIKIIGNFFGLWDFISNIIGKLKKDSLVWFNERYYAIMPAHVAGIIKIFDKINYGLYNIATEYVDSVSTCIVIACLILFFTVAPIFLGVQIYSEGINVVQLTGSLINRTVVHNPELMQLLPPGWNENVDSVLDNAYVYGREGLSKAIKSIFHDADSEKCIKLENQLLELWDRVYQTWITHNSDVVGPKVTAEAIEQTWRSFVSDITKTPEMLNTGGLLDFAKQNVGTLMTLMESVWSILKGNLTLVFGSVSAVSSVLLGGGSAVLNFLLSLIVFFTTLFYLLNSSGTLYKPIEFISKFSPINGSAFGLAMTDAVNGVFIATMKMAFFYGLWTWLIHSLFGAKIVYLPAALAAVLAVFPFLGTYLACIPAVLDLWLAQDSPVLAILLAICQFAPTSYVDTVIYKEIKNGGHPYFTGLAIAGGIFCLGVEGAIFGPVLLCCLLVAFNLSSTIFKDTPLEEQLSAASLQSQLAN